MAQGTNLHLQYFVEICFSPTFYTLTANFTSEYHLQDTTFVTFFHFYSETQNTQSADTEPVYGH